MEAVTKILGIKPFTCPQCGQELPLADLNMAANAALCRACGYAGPFLNAQAIPRLTDEQLARPPKRVQLERGFGDSLSVICRPSRWPLLFLIPFATFWSGISMTVIYIIPLFQGEFDWATGLIGVPFLLGTIPLLLVILFHLFGKTVVTLSKGRVTVHTGLFGKGRTREMDRSSGMTVSLEPSNYRVNNVPQPEIVLADEGREIRFGAMMLSKDAKPYVAAVLQRAVAGR